MVADRAEAHPTAPKKCGHTEVSDKPSIGALPFVNATSDLEQQFFVEGIADGVVTELSKHRSLKVKSLIWSTTPDEDRVAIGKEYEVRYLLDGRVQKGKDRVRVDAQLVDVATGQTEWADRLDRAGDDILALQDDTARDVATQLYGYDGLMQELDLERSSRKPPNSLTAYELVLLGEWHHRNWTREENDKAKAHIRQAIALDPQYSDAYASLSLVSSLEIWLRVRNPSEVIGEAIELAKTAISLDRRSELAHTALGHGDYMAKRYDRSLEAYDKSLFLNPNNAFTVSLRGCTFLYLGRVDDAISSFEQAKQLNPRFDLADWGLGEALFMAKHYTTALEATNRLIGQESNPSVVLLRAAVHARLERYEEAAEETSRLLKLLPGYRMSTDWAIDMHVDDANRNHLKKALRTAGDYRHRLVEFEAKYPNDVGKLGVKANVLCPWVDELARREIILDVIEDLLGPDIVLWGCSFRIKPADGRTFAEWHQDSWVAALKPFFCSATLAFSEYTQANGCLSVIPGSHRWGDLPMHDTGDEDSILTRPYMVTSDFDESTTVDVLLRPGEMTVQHDHAIHGSRPNRSGARRIGMLASFAPTHSRNDSEQRESTVLVRGADAYGYFEGDPVPAEEMSPAALAAWEGSAGVYLDNYQAGNERGASDR